MARDSSHTLMTPDNDTDSTLVLGTLVRYYSDGWRYGHLTKVKGESATIRPMAPYKGGQPRDVTVPLKDVHST